MAQGVVLGNMGYLLHREVAERTARGRQQYLLDGVVVLAHQTLEDGRVLAVNGQDGGVVLRGQVANQLASHHQRLLVGQGNGLVGLDGMDGGRQTGEAYHGRQHDVDGAGLHDLVQSLRTGIHLHVGQVAHQPLQLVVASLVGNDNGGGFETVGLLSQQFYAVVGCQTIYFIEVGMLGNDLQCLGSNRTCGA